VGEHTTLSKASTKNDSLRTTVPASIVHFFKLKEGDKIDWELKAFHDEMIIIVKRVDKNSKE
jgi:bifunctional DNA-binding transcriptional regulator/antitoxin component of YhaV-PrlF toxin-antitoxin module